MSERRVPDYTVRRSARARRVRLTVTARDGLVVTLPARLPERVAADAVASRLQWAERELARVGERRSELLAGPDALLPSHIEFAAFGEVWTIEYRETTALAVRVRERPGELVASGGIEDGAACLAGLRRWRDRAARVRLERRVIDLARDVGATPTRVSVRGQRSRWGSCSSTGTISLNRNLVFLPESLADHVILHELAHLTHADHSKAFYERLETYDAAAAAHRGELREAWRHVPAWAEG